MMKTTKERVAAIKQRSEAYKKRRDRRIKAGLSLVGGVVLTVCVIAAFGHRSPETVLPEYGFESEGSNGFLNQDSSSDRGHVPVSAQITQSDKTAYCTDEETLAQVLLALETVSQRVIEDSEDMSVPECAPEEETPTIPVTITLRYSDGTRRVFTVTEDTYVDSEGTEHSLPKKAYDAFVATLKTIGG